MNAKKFPDAMSELNTKYVDEALNYKKKAKIPIGVKWGTIAACITQTLTETQTDMPHSQTAILLMKKYQNKPLLQSK